MRAQFAQRLLALVLALVGFLSLAHGGNWYCDPFNQCDCEFDWQWFAPPQDFCCEPNPPANEGYFFEGERMHFWLMRPDRLPVGNTPDFDPDDPNGGLIGVWVPNSVTLVYGSNPADANPFVIPIPGSANSSLIYPVVGGGADGFQFNAIDDGISEASEGWEERYTFGRVSNDCGWMVSIVPEMKIHITDRYGFDDKRRDQLGGAQGLDGIDGSPDPDGPTGAGMPVQPVNPVAGIQGILPIDGLLSVPVLFNDPYGLLLGNRDEDGDGIFDVGAPPFPIIDPTDLTRIAVVFDDLKASNEMRLTSVELMLVRRKRRLHSGFDLEAFCGARYFELDDYFGVVARGGVLTDSEWHNNAENRIVGPQIGCRAARQRGKWTTTFNGRFMAGANFLSIRQNGVLGSHLPVGFAGVPYAVGGNTFFHRVNSQFFSPLGEFRFDLGCQINRAISLKVGWTGIAAGGIARASNTIRYDFPQLGIQQRQEEVFAHGVTFGFELNR